MRKRWRRWWDAEVAALDGLGRDGETAVASAVAALEAARPAIDRRVEDARAAIAFGAAALIGITEHAAALAPRAQAIVEETVGGPLRALAEQADTVASDLERLVADACAFLREDVAPALAAAAERVGVRASTLTAALAEDAAHAVEAAQVEWESALVEALDALSETDAAEWRERTDLAIDAAVVACSEACEAHLARVEELSGPPQDALVICHASLEASILQIRAAGESLLEEIAGAAASAAEAQLAVAGLQALFVSHTFP
jgi:hypothetical protein